MKIKKEFHRCDKCGNMWEKETPTSQNSDYAKCCEDIEKLMMYRGDMTEQGKLTEILKKHFASKDDCYVF